MIIQSVIVKFHCGIISMSNHVLKAIDIEQLDSI